MNAVTTILRRLEAGDAGAAGELFPAVYGELKAMAAARMAAELPGQTLQATALVHEAWLRLGGDQSPAWKNRAHFFGAVGEAMRRILVDQARRRGREKRGGGAEVEALDESRIELNALPDEILEVHEALEQLGAEDPVAASVVKLRYFAGLPVPEVAEALELSPRTVDRLWAFARVRLRQILRPESIPGHRRGPGSVSVA